MCLLGEATILPLFIWYSSLQHRFRRPVHDEIRNEQIKTFHQSMFGTAQSWSEIRSNSLLYYLFEHGAKHAFKAECMSEMSELMLDYEYEWCASLKVE